MELYVYDHNNNILWLIEQLYVSTFWFAHCNVKQRGPDFAEEQLSWYNNACINIMNKTRIIAVRYCRLRGYKSYVILLQRITIEISELLRVSGSRPSLKFIAFEKVGMRKFHETCSITGWRSNRVYVTNVIFHRRKRYLVRKNIMTHYLRIKLQNSSVLLFLLRFLRKQCRKTIRVTSQI